MSIDISDEAKTVMANIQQNVQKMYENVTKLEDVEKRQRGAERQVKKKKQRELEKVKQYANAIEILLAKRRGNTEEFVNQTFDRVSGEISSSMKTAKKDILSTRNWALQIERMVAISDKVSLIEHSHALAVSFEKHAGRMEFYSKVAPENSLKQCQLSFTDQLLNKIFSPVFMNETMKVVSKVIDCEVNKRYLGPCRSLAVFRETCFTIFGLSLYKSEPPFSHFVNTGNVMKSLFPNRGLCVVRGDCYYSDGEEVKVWKQIDQSSKTVAIFTMFPLCVAYRNRGDYEELLVCLNEDKFGLYKGLVRVLPLCPGQAAYDFLPEADSGPSRVAVNRTNGLVCLSYSYHGKISVHSEAGALIQTYDQSYMGLSSDFLPMDICFDNENCIVIAVEGTFYRDRLTKRQDGQVLRVNIFGKVLQVLLKGCHPTAIEVSHDDKLWVGYDDGPVTLYQMKNKGAAS